MAKVIRCPKCDSRNISYVGEEKTVYCNANGAYPMWCKRCDILWYSYSNPSKKGVACPKCKETRAWNHSDDEKGVTQFFENWDAWNGAGTS